MLEERAALLIKGRNVPSALGAINGNVPNEPNGRFPVSLFPAHSLKK